MAETWSSYVWNCSYRRPPQLYADRIILASRQAVSNLLTLCAFDEPSFRARGPDAGLFRVMMTDRVVDDNHSRHAGEEGMVKP